MQLLNDTDRPELYAKNATQEDAITVNKMVENMNDSLKSAGYDYQYITDFIDGFISIRQLT